MKKTEIKHLTIDKETNELIEKLNSLYPDDVFITAVLRMIERFGLKMCEQKGLCHLQRIRYLPNCGSIFLRVIS